MKSDEQIVKEKFPKSRLVKKGGSFVVYKTKFEQFPMLRCFNENLAWSRARQIIEKEERENK